MLIRSGDAGGNRRLLGDLAETLRREGRLAEALETCALILREAPEDLAALLLQVRLLSETGEIEAALTQLMRVRARDPASEDVIAEVKHQAIIAAAVYQRCIAEANLERALGVCDLLVELCPWLHTFHKAQRQTRDMLMRRQAEQRLQQHHPAQAAQMSWAWLHSLEAAATARHEAGALDAELTLRLAIWRHPLDRLQHSSLRIRNIGLALARLLAADVAAFDTDRLAQARALLAEVAAMPQSPPATEHVDDDPVACWERQQRLLFGTIDIDTIFGPPAAPTPPLAARFCSAAGARLTAEAVVGRAGGARVVFASSASAEYLLRDGPAYVRSILAACDCDFLILLHVCVPHDQLAGLAARLGLVDPRLILCSDGFDAAAQPVRIYGHDPGPAGDIPGGYYACAALLHLEELLRMLHLPVFLTGIDTLLQRRVADLLARFADHDVVLNLLGSDQLLNSQYVNNLVLAYPTENGLLFAQFLRTYLGGHMRQPVQATYLDQLDLLMAKLHLTARGTAPRIGHFAETDINNAMFTRDNFCGHLARIRGYRFLNMFASLGPAKALTIADLAAAAR